MLKMACSGNPSEVTHIHKETHYAVKYSKEVNRNYRRVSVRPGDVPDDVIAEAADCIKEETEKEGDENII